MIAVVIPTAPTPGNNARPSMEVLVGDTMFEEISLVVNWVLDFVHQIWEPLYTTVIDSGQTSRCACQQPPPDVEMERLNEEDN